MSYHWQLTDMTSFTGKEASWEYFETLRRAIWNVVHVDAGILPPDYTSSNCIVQGDWNTFCDNTGLDDSDLASDGPFVELTNVAYINTVHETSGDLYSAYGTFGSLAGLKANPPVLSDGTFNDTKWRKMASYHVYHDWDLNSGRYVLSHDYRTIPAYRYLPRQTDPKYQQNPVKYTDTERVVPHRLSVEKLWKHISQPYALGPVYSIDVQRDDYGNYDYSKWQGGEDIGLTGGEYTNVVPEPGLADGGDDDALPLKEADTGQSYWNPKLCDAYQNAIEEAVCRGGWVLEIDPETAWGAAYIENYNFYKTSYPEPAEFDGGPYSYGELCMYDDVCWMSQADSNTDTPALTGGNWSMYARKWGDDRYNDTSAGPNLYPKYGSLGESYWGCNNSGFELLLWVSGQYDWWFDPTYKWAPYHILYAREDLRYTTPPFSEADIETLYPLGAGRWRRTWKYTFGRPQDATLMVPQEKGTPAGDTYSDCQDDVVGMGHVPMRFYGIYSHTTPSVTLTDEEEAYLSARHDQPYECTAVMAEQMWDILDLLEYIGSDDLTLTIQNRNVYYGITDSTDTSSDIWDDAVAGAEAAIGSASWADAGGTPPVGYIGWHGGVGLASGGVRGGHCVLEEGRIKIANSSGMIGTGIYSSDSISVLLCGVEVVYDGTIPNTEYEVSDIELEMPDGTALIVGDEVSTAAGEKRVFHYIGLGPGEIAYTTSDIYRDIVNNSVAPTIDDYAGTISVEVSRKHYFEKRSSLGPTVMYHIDWSLVPTAVYSTDRRWEYTAVAVDDGKFDSNGLLN